MSLQRSSSNFTTATIVSQNTDGWQSNWASSYLNIISGTPNQLRVRGTAPAIVRTFTNVQANNEHHLTYTQTQNNAVQLVVEQSANGTTWSTLLTANSANGTQTQTFTPTASFLRVRYSAISSFQVSEVILNGVDETMVVNVTPGGFAKYRYGFNGQEKDDEVSGKGNSYTAEFWQYDSRLGRRWNIDPMSSKYPWQSPYATFNDNPIFFADPLGLEGTNSNAKKSGDGPEQLDEVLVEAKRPSWFDRFVYKCKKAIGIGYTTKGQKQRTGPDWLNRDYNGLHKDKPTLGSEGKGVYYTDKTNPHYAEWLKGRANHEALENFIAAYAGGSLAAPFAIAGAVTTAPVWTPYVAMGANGAMRVARAYNVTFGMKGGYANMGYNYYFQSSASGDWGIGSKDLLAIGAQGFMKTTTPVWQQSLLGASSALVQYTPNGGLTTANDFSISYVAGSAMNGFLLPMVANSKYGNNLSANFIFGGSQAFMNAADSNGKK